MCAVGLFDGGFCFVVVAAAGGEASFDLFQQRVGYGIFAVFFQRGEQAVRFVAVVPQQVEDQPLKVAGDQDIHTGGYRGVERAAAIVAPRGEEFREHVVLVGGAYQLVHRQTHASGVPAREDVAEVAGGHAEVDLVAVHYRALREQVRVGGEIVYDLRHEAAPVDRVGGREAHVVFQKPLFYARVGKDGLHAGLRVVKVALDGANAHVVPLLRGHLQLLHRAHALIREKHEDARSRHVFEALQRGLAGIAGGRDQYHALLALQHALRRAREQMGQQLQRHILERAGGAVPQLQNAHVVVQRGHRRGGGALEPAAVSGGGVRFQLFFGVIR